MAVQSTNTFDIIVPPSGPVTAPIVFIGEAPAKTEVFEGKPFMGSAGDHLNNCLSLAGLDRSEIYITNISKRRVPEDKMEKLDLVTLARYEKELIEEINNLPNVKIIVPLGAYALKAVTTRSGITNFRGSVLHPHPAIKHDCLVVPTLHPSNLHYNYPLWILIVADLTRVRRIRDKDFQFEWPKQNFILAPSFEQTMSTLKMLQETKPRFAVVDVETPGNMLSCVGIAWSRSDAICIPFFYGNGQSYWKIENEMAIWRELDKTLKMINMAGQNILFDWRILGEHGFRVGFSYPSGAFIRDSMLMHHCLYSEMKHGLDTIVSIYTDLPFFKKDEEEKKGSALIDGKETEHWTYNSMDCIGTYWAIEELEQELKDENMLHVYENLYSQVLPILFEMNMLGVPVDLELLKDVRLESNELIKQYNAKIKEETGLDVNVNSTPQVTDLLYNKLGWEKYTGEKTGKETLKKLAYKYKSDIPDLIIDIRAARKTLSLFDESNVVDGHIKCEYSLGRTSTGRLNSRKGRGRSGMNLQNVKKGPQRKFFIPPKGYVMMCADQQNAEARVVAWLADDENMMGLFKSGASLHLVNAKNMFKEDITKEDPRYKIAKACVHGANYGLGPRKFAQITKLQFSDAQTHLINYHNTYPGIREHFHAYVYDEIMAHRMLYNPFGRREIFLDELMYYGNANAKVLQAGYAFIPQSTVTDINKQALKRIRKHFRVLLESHDGLSIAVPEGQVQYGAEALVEAYDIHFKIWDIDRTVPIDLSFGPNWDEQIDIIL